MPLLSVIIPVYNVERYIKKCFDSIIVQIKDADVEIICINDGSTDKSGEICDEYAAKYNKIKVYHQNNKGVAAARNYGLSIIKGQYIAWIDPDDYISNKWYENISTLIMEEQPDILFFDYVLMDNNNLKIKCFADKTDYISQEKFLTEIVKDVKIQSQLWQKVFKRELFKNIRFPENIKCMEDYAILHKIILKANKIYYLKKILYFYRIRENSLVKKFDLEKSFKCYLIAKERYSYLNNTKIEASKIGYLIQALGFCIQFCKINAFERKNYSGMFRICKNEINRNIFYILVEKEFDIRIKLKFLLCYLSFLKTSAKIYNFIKNIRNKGYFNY